MKKLIFINLLSFILTSLSLFYQRNVPVNRIVVDKIEEVDRLAGGFPFVFLIDGDFTSPSNDISVFFIFGIRMNFFLITLFLIIYFGLAAFGSVTYLF